MHGIADIAGWRWLFAIEGIPAIILGVMVLWLLPSSPEKAHWLTGSEKEWLVSQLEEDNRNVMVNKNHSWLSALKNKVVLLLSLVWFLQAFGSIGITLFLPLILKASPASKAILLLAYYPRCRLFLPAYLCILTAGIPISPKSDRCIWGYH